jgi:hypothetical protein
MKRKLIYFCIVLICSCATNTKEHQENRETQAMSDDYEGAMPDCSSDGDVIICDWDDVPP